MNNLYYNNKRIKKIKRKRTQKVKKVWGWILTVMGGILLPEAIGSILMGNPGDTFGCLLFLIPGLLLLLTAKRQVDRWDQYEAIIDNRGNTPISLIARKMKLPENRVYTDLQNMIHSDFFIGPNYNIEAYIDAERDLLVMTSGGKPLRPLPDLPTEEEIRAEEEARAREDARAQAKAGPGPAFGGEAASEPPDADFRTIDEEPLTEEVELTELELIQQAIADTPDDEVRNYLYGLEGSLRRIDERIQDRPELREKLSIKRLYRFYLPQILELIRKYHAPDTPRDLKDQIRDALRTSADALANIEADLLERDQMDAEVNIEVLKNMFAQDGLLSPGGQTRADQARPDPQPAPSPQPR